MNAAAEDTTTTASRPDRLRPLRYLVRAPLLLVHVLIALPLALLVINPLGARIRVGPHRLDHWMVCWWSRWLVRCFGFKVKRFGQPVPGAALFVANHVSWLDIELLHSQAFLCFVAKAEISRWPLVGWLAGRAGTIYHQRGSGHSLASVMEVMVERLRSGLPVGVFPEGGTGSGEHVRTFHARIFQVAVDAGVPVQPVALLYGDNGRQDPAVPFGPGESFLANFLRVLGGRSMSAEVHFCEPLSSSDDGRRRTAETARSRIVDALGHAE
ncbi:lysophospholipid acyltransferase family protein [Tahibacter amnicola]|uniref:1-acyl-sn-glycerol-3-phosphate acyltransferase n=1 Tax=Tahibacter amnicola TaxID=2976241 RepID=A0ABY6BES4_9GAMM|nr:lysophospholipid acyltransferase family protein [Tahibacter amnicola]UXI68310.1 1-acyl-sn-glycerol-3-phosphate acyltransferase [Tahibacter amnicola]